MNPYKNLNTRAFWKPAVAERQGQEVENLWWPKFQIGPKDTIITAGSCFAQNIGRALRQRGMNWLETETPPKALPRALHAAHGYGVFTFRTGNIYTTPLLRQWLSWASGSPASQEVWEKDGLFYDPFRPSVAPGGFASKAQVLESRQVTIAAVRRAVEEASVFLYTPGLTETWINHKTGEFYPACPGTICGDFQPEQHIYRNIGFLEGHAALDDAIAIMRKLNPDIRVLLTVSPVPVTATQEPHHVLAASCYTKSTLRTIIGEIVHAYDYVDYFPSYELVTTPPLGPSQYGENNRTISKAGIDNVMAHFFAALGVASNGRLDLTGDIVCEDEILSYYDEN